MMSLVVAAALVGGLDGFDRILIERRVKAVAEARPGDIPALREEVAGLIPGGWEVLSGDDLEYAERVVSKAIRPGWHKVRGNGYIFYVKGVKNAAGKIDYRIEDQPPSTKNVILYGDPAGPPPPPPVAVPMTSVSPAPA